MSAGLQDLQTNGSAPELSCILVVGSQRERAARALGSILSQSRIDRMEILLFDLGPQDCPPLPNSDHPRVRLTRWDPSGLLSAARAQGIHAAKSPIIAFMEEHCEMQAGWAETVILAHQGPWAAVGGDFTNGNPNVGTSDKAFRMNYGVYVRPVSQRGPTPSVAGQNSAFKRDVLLRYAPHLELMLNAELILQLKMQQDGYQMWYEPSAQIAHRNETSLRSLAVGAFYWNWCYSNVRARIFEWSTLRRAAWIALTPLIPWVRLFRVGRRMAASGFSPFVQLVRDIPFFLAITHVSVAGQVLGLLRPINRGVRGFSHFEMNEPRPARPELSR